MLFSKIKVHLKLIAILTLLVFLLPSTTLATEGIFLPISSAKKVAVELDYCYKSQANNSNIISLLKEENHKYVKLSDAYKEKVSLFQKDKDILKKRGDDFEKVFNKCSDDLNQCIEEKPSRMVWFGIGSISTMIIGLVSLFLIKN